MDLFLFSSLVFTASFLVLGAILHTLAAANGRKTTHLPPSPPALPILGHLHLLRPLLHQAFHVLAARYGPLFRLRFPAMGNVLVVSSPAMAKEFLSTEGRYELRRGCRRDYRKMHEGRQILDPCKILAFGIKAVSIRH